MTAQLWLRSARGTRREPTAAMLQDDAAADAATPPIAMAAHKSPLRTPGSYPRRRDSRTRQTHGRFKTGSAPITELRGRAAAPVRRRPAHVLTVWRVPGATQAPVREA